METVDNTVAQEVDPLNMPAGGVDTSMPKLVEKLYVMTIAEAKSQTNEQTQKTSIRIVLKTIDEQRSTDGDVVNAGYPVYDYFGYTPSEKYSNADIAKKGAGILKACGLKDVTVRDFINNPSIINDKTVTVKLGLRKEEGSFPASNTVKTWIEPK